MTRTYFVRPKQKCGHDSPWLRNDYYVKKQFAKEDIRDWFDTYFYEQER